MNDASSPDNATCAETPAEREVTLQQVLDMAQQLQREERFADAEAIYLQVLQQMPEEPNVLNFFGVLRHQQGRHDEALALLEMAIKHAPDEPGPWTNLANVLIERGYHDDAIKALNHVIALAPKAVMPHNNLGILHTRRGEWVQAETALKSALALGPRLSYVHYNLAGLYFRTGRMRECAAHNLQSIDQSRDNPRARMLLSRALFLLGEDEQAIQNLREWQEEVPDSPEAAHYLAAAGVTDTPLRASDDYVKEVFDRFAESFEMQLEKLGYQAPKMVCDELLRLRGRLPSEAAILDAGCGTGLCGPLLRPLATRLEGVDLSAGMLRRAEPRGDYDQLHQAELTAFLRDRPAAFDAVVSSDVFNYFGALDPLMEGVARALRPGGVLVATVEALPEEVTRDYVLQVHGRYAHNVGYLKAVLARQGLKLDKLEAHVLRQELAEPVHGWVFSAVRSTIAAAP